MMCILYSSSSSLSSNVHIVVVIFFCGPWKCNKKIRLQTKVQSLYVNRFVGAEIKKKIWAPKKMTNKIEKKKKTHTETKGFSPSTNKKKTNKRMVLVSFLLWRSYSKLCWHEIGNFSYLSCDKHCQVVCTTKKKSVEEIDFSSFFFCVCCVGRLCGERWFLK